MFQIKPQTENVTKTFRLPSDMADRLEQLAAKNRLSLNRVVVQCLGYALDNLEEPEEKTSPGV